MKQWILVLALLLCGIEPVFKHAKAQAPLAKFKEHITYLADDDLEGRETGTDAEDMAALYISQQFTAAGLLPAGPGKDWLQDFSFLNNRKPAESCTFKLGGKELVQQKDCFPFPHSADGEFKGEAMEVGYGIHAPNLRKDDYKKRDVSGKVLVIRRGTPDGNNPHGKYSDYSPIAVKIAAAEKMGAKAVIFVDPDEDEMTPPMLDFTRRTNRSKLPVVWLKGKKAADLDGKMVMGSIKLDEEHLTGHNVLGLLDKGAELTIVIGAHYDHLGFGDAGSLHRGERAIHNGADDNASGTALIMELAKTFKAQQYNKFNYLFIAFSGEEKGLLGSNYFCKNPTIELSKVNCMLNFDMVGRLDPGKNTLGINGTGTSPFWEKTLAAIQIDDMKLKTTASGVGPSDHTSFYLKDMPVLHFFSGTHSDYHKPSDDVELINYHGMDMIYRYVVALVGKLNEKGDQLAFTKTKNEQGDVPRWKVSLGVVPDYLYDGKGMRIDGITDGRPAAKAGLKAGDVVVKMGKYDVPDMMGYMRALSKFESGDKVKVVVLRGKAEVMKKVKF